MEVTQELCVYIVGDREEIAQEQNPVILFQNCRGVRPSSTAMLKVNIEMHKPTIVFLIDTRSSSSRIGRLCYSLGYQHYRVCPAHANDVSALQDFIGSKHKNDPDNCVGLAILWKGNLDLELCRDSNNYLDFEVKIKVAGKSEILRLSAVYGDPKNKKNTLKFLREVSANYLQYARLVFGDFNQISDLSERIGGKDSKKQVEKLKADIKRFNECLLTYLLIDLRFEGTNIFTYTGPGEFKERLDRVLASRALINLFPHLKVRHLIDQTISDHIPILVETNSQIQSPLRTMALMESMDELLSFAGQMESAYEGLTSRTFMTVSIMRSVIRPVFSEFYFDITQNVIPHILRIEYIAVHDRDEETVKCERLVRFKIHSDLRAFVLNCLAIPRPSQETYDHRPIPEFPSCAPFQKEKDYNFSEFLTYTWELVALIPENGTIHQQEIVNSKRAGQLKNLIDWYNQVIYDIRKGPVMPRHGVISSMESTAFRIQREVIVGNTIIALFRRKMIKAQGTVKELNGIILDEYKHYFPDQSPDQSREDCQAVLVSLLIDFRWCQGKDDPEYRITESLFNRALMVFNDLEERMFHINRDIMLMMRLKPWIRLIEEQGGPDEKKLAAYVDTSTIEGQIKLLERMGCISISEKQEIAFIRDRNHKSIVNRLKRAANEAFKTLKNKTTKKKSMKESAYTYRLKEAYMYDLNLKKDGR